MDVPLLGCDGAHVDFLAIDDLLDFSNDDISEPIDSCLTTTCTDSSAPSSEESKPSAQESSPPDKGFSLQPSLCGFDSDELCVPCDDLAELEWLSNFVEESFSTGDHAPASFCLGYEGKSATENYNSVARRTEQESHSRSSPVSVLESNTQSGTKRMCFNTAADMAIPARARTKRGRTAVCFWNTRILSAEASESLLDCSSTASTITSDSDMINAYYEHDDDDEDYEQDEEEDNEDDDDDNIEFDDDRMGYDCQYKRPPSSASPAKKKKKKKFGKGIAGFCSSKPKKLKVQEGEQQQEQRKCLHCASTKTPQWRAGPMGPKTLCNACGVRYKSGRLCAEYRPAASPTFIESVHSNSHRKVMEMRRQRGVGTLPFRSAMAEPLCCPDGGDQ